MKRRRNNMLNSRNLSELPGSVPALLASGAGLVVMVMGLPVFAQSANQGDHDAEITEIVVTAQKVGAESIQRTPIAMSAFSADDLSRTFTNNIKGLGDYAPNVNIGETNTNAMIYIRRIGTNNVFSSSDPDRTVQLDGIYLHPPSPLFTHFIHLHPLAHF